MLYVKRIRLQNIRCFEDLEISFGRGGASALLIGDNNSGKSTVLRSLAMGLCDQSSASALFRELPGEFVRRGADFMGVITVDLGSKDGWGYRVQTEIHALEAFERVEQKLWRVHGRREFEVEQDDFPWDRIFVSGYGAGIRVQGTADFDYYLAADALYSLFRYDTPLQNPELVIRRLIDKQRKARRKRSKGDVLAEIKTLLGLLLQLRRKDRVVLTPTGVKVKGDWGETELSSLGDGYRATLTWVLDLIGWWFVKREQENGDRQGYDPGGDISGIVLLDEIEQHLHPRWQRNIMHLLTESFPRVQFLATSHSPLVASGCDDIQVHRWVNDEDHVEEPFGWLAEDVYRLMGVASSRAEEFRRQVLDRFSALDKKRLLGKASKQDLTELRALRQELEKLPPSDPLLLTTELANIRQALEGISEEEGQN